MALARIKVDGQVFLKLYCFNDAEAIFSLIEKNIDHISRFGMTLNERYPNLKSLVDDMERPSLKDCASYSIWDDQTLVGSVHYTPFFSGREAEIGYWLGEEFQRKGYATRSAAALVNNLFTQPRLNKVTAIVNTANVRSQNVLERLGFLQEPVFTEAYVRYTRTSPIPSHQLYTSPRA